MRRAGQAGHGRIEGVEPEGVLRIVEQPRETDPVDGIAWLSHVAGEARAQLIPRGSVERAPRNQPERAFLLVLCYRYLVHRPITVGRKEPGRTLPQRLDAPARVAQYIGHVRAHRGLVP